MYRGDTSEFLLLLALGTSFPMVIGFFLVRRIPLPAYEILSSTESGAVQAGPSDDSDETLLGNGVHTPLLTEQSAPPIDSSVSRTCDSLALSSTHSHAAIVTTTRMLGSLPNIHGKQLLTSVDFWTALALMSICEFPAACLCEVEACIHMRVK